MLYVVIDLFTGDAYTFGDVDSAVAQAGHLLSGCHPVHMYSIHRTSVPLI